MATDTLDPAIVDQVLDLRRQGLSCRRIAVHLRIRDLRGPRDLFLSPRDVLGVLRRQRRRA